MFGLLIYNIIIMFQRCYRSFFVFVLCTLLITSLCIASIFQQSKSNLPTQWPPREAKIASSVNANQFSKPPSVEVRPLGDGTFECQFSFQSIKSAQRVNLAGEFNGWNTQATAMSRGDDGVWRVTVQMPAGQQQYKFVADGDQWQSDPRNDQVISDGQGETTALFDLAHKQILVQCERCVVMERSKEVEFSTIHRVHHSYSDFRMGNCSCVFAPCEMMLRMSNSYLRMGDMTG